LWHFEKREIDRALTAFNNALELEVVTDRGTTKPNRNCIPALFGKVRGLSTRMGMNLFLTVSFVSSNCLQARILYLRKDYKTALAVYQQILKADPLHHNPDPRIGIGLCFNKLGMIPEAYKAFMRAVQVVRLRFVLQLCFLRKMTTKVYYFYRIR
jgi:tetratricopeptide (TPR) repeat protein